MEKILIVEFDEDYPDILEQFQKQMHSFTKSCNKDYDCHDTKIEQFCRIKDKTSLFTYPYCKSSHFINLYKLSRL